MCSPAQNAKCARRGEARVFALMTGLVAVSRSRQGGSSHLERRRPRRRDGRSSRVATAVALVDVTAMVMIVREFERILVDHPSVAGRIQALADPRRKELAA